LKRKMQTNDIIARRSVIFIENDTIGDDWFNPLLVQTLREFAEMVEKKHAGHEGVEIYNSPNGTKLTIISNIWYGTLLPDLNLGLADK